MLKEIADPSGVFPFSSERDPRISAVHCFGYHPNMSYSGPDLCCAGTLRVPAAKSADRALIAFPFSDSFNHVKNVNQMEASINPKTSDIINYMRILSQEQLDCLPFNVHHGVFGSNTIVYIPPGWLMFEKSLGNFSTGIVTTLMPATGTTAENLNALIGMAHGVSIQGNATFNLFVYSFTNLLTHLLVT